MADGGGNDIQAAEQSVMLDDKVFHVVDGVLVVAIAAIHRIGAGAAVQDVNAAVGTADQAVVAATAGEKIETVATVQYVGGTVAFDGVSELVPRAIDRLGSGQHQVLQPADDCRAVFGEIERNRTVNSVYEDGAFGFIDSIEDVVDDV